MRRKFKLKVSYTFNGCFTLRAASRQPLLREGQAYAEIRRYGIYDATTVDEWSENNNDNS